MSERSLATTAEQLADEDDKNSTADWPRIRVVNATGFEWIDEIAAQVPVNNTAYPVVGSTTLRINADPWQAHPFVTYGPWEGNVSQSSFVQAASFTVIQPAYELLRAIINATEDQRLQCMRVLGMIDQEDEDEYVDPGPDPQPVDSDWLASIRAGRSHS